MQKIVQFELNTNVHTRLLISGVFILIGLFALLGDSTAVHMGIPSSLARATAGVTSFLVGIFFLVRTQMSR